MPRKTASRLELRKQVEAAEKSAPKKSAAKKKKKATKKRTTRRTKESAPERKRLVWVIYTATLREEARFPYDQRKEAEERLESLLSKGKRTYFLQPVKELVSGAAVVPVSDSSDEDDDDVVESSEEMEAQEGDEELDLDVDVDDGDMDEDDMDDMPDDDD
ncbi:MAG: hypothetical protein KDA78_07565 [Planctomycetaceae bacterium]|nr:hypothetical protein [Planctomycetaceae bacterium]